MNSRFLLYIAFFLVTFMIWQQWKIEQNLQFQNFQNKQNAITDKQDMPDLAAQLNQEKEKNFSAEEKSLEELRGAKNTDIRISNKDLEITIDVVGGTIKKTKLLNYFEKVSDKIANDRNKHINLLNYNQNYYVAQSGLIHDLNPVNDKSERLAPNHYDEYTVKEKSNNRVILEWKNKNGEISVIKKISLFDSGYSINFENEIYNFSNKNWIGRQYRQIRKANNGESSSWITPTFTGASYYDGKYNKISYEEISEKNLKLNNKSGWLSMMEHYFVSSWYFSKKENNLFYTKEILVNDNRRDYIIGARSEQIKIQPNESVKVYSSFYTGPKLQKELEKISDGLELTIDYGVLTFIAKPLFWLLDKIFVLIGNWGWAIILLTLLIKLVFYKLSESSYKAMAKMKQFSPRILAIRERYGSDRQKMNQAMMEMYRKEKINPIGGCLPVLVQIPVFIALYWVLLESVELRHAEFIFWLNDLSTKDPYFVLPLLMGVSMYIQQKLNPAPPDPIQAKVMQMLPIIFTAFFAFFPSGLVLYWVANNVLSIAQQWKITKAIELK